MIKDNKDDIYIELFKWAKKKVYFTLEDIKKENKFKDYFSLIEKEMQQSRIFICLEDNFKYALSFEDRFRLLEYEELQQAKKQSNIATWIAIIAMIITVIIGIAQIIT